jgi:5-formyltetrahydrofolate cyclo-ligase
MGIADEKKRLREIALRRRDEIEAAARDGAFDNADLDFLGLSGPAVISGFHSVGSEADCIALLGRLAAQGHQTCLPVVLRGEPLVFRAWKPGEALIRGVLDIPVPPEDAPVVVPDVLFVPLLAFDRTGYRVGYGGGYYDRTLNALRAQKPILAVGLAFAVQEVEAVPREAFDERLDYVLTERGVIEMVAE